MNFVECIISNVRYLFFKLLRFSVIFLVQSSPAYPPSVVLDAWTCWVAGGLFVREGLIQTLQSLLKLVR